MWPSGHKQSFKGSEDFARYVSTITALYKNISTKLCKNSIIEDFLEILRLYKFFKREFLYYKHNINFYIAK